MRVLGDLILCVNTSVGDTGFIDNGFYVLVYLTIFVLNSFYGSKFGIKRKSAFSDRDAVPFGLRLDVCFSPGGKMAYWLGTS